MNTFVCTATLSYSFHGLAHPCHILILKMYEAWTQDTNMMQHGYKEITNPTSRI